MRTHSIDALIREGRFREAGAVLDELPNLTLAQKVQRAYVQSECNGAAVAAAAANSLLGARLTNGDRATCLTILAMAASFAGDLRQGLCYFEQALKLVCDDALETAVIELRFTKTLLNWIGIEPAMSRLPALRRAVTRSGDGYTATGLHLLCAEINLNRGKPSSALLHISAAEHLLQRYPHLTNEYRLFQIKSIWAAAYCRFDRALEFVTKSLVTAERAGRSTSLASALANIAHFSLLLGNVDHARAVLAEAQKQPLPDTLTVCLAATDIEVHIASENFDAALHVANAVNTTAQTLEHGHAFYALWFTAGRVRALTRAGHAGEAARLAIEAIPYTDRFADKGLSVYMRLHAAEALIYSANIPAAGNLIKQLLTEHQELAADHLGELSRIRSLISASGWRHHERARRIFSSVGLLTAVQQLALDRQSGKACEEQTTPSDAARSVTESWLTILETFQSEETVGRELLEILKLSGVGLSAALAKKTQDEEITVATIGGPGQTETGATTEVRIEIPSTDATTRWSVSVQIAADSDCEIDLMNIDRALRRLYSHTHRVSEEPLISLGGLDGDSDPSGMIVASEKLAEMLRLTRRVASSSVSVLITGETGTGKELLARVLHEDSSRRGKQFVPFNCTSVSRDLIDSQLFGHRRGAFTGAQDAFQGVIRAATGGTLFLDEIGEMPLDVQPKLLRFLESGEIHPLGEARPLNVDVRVVAATNADLEQLVAQGKFREDLYYRLNVVRLQVPPLRERREEIPVLTHYFLERFGRESGKSGIRLAEETMEYLVLFRWPGNVRQLANEIRRMVALTEPGAILMPEHLSSTIAASRRTLPVSDRPIAPMEFVVRMDQPLSAAMKHLESSMVQYALATAGDRLEDAARMLGLSRKGLYLKRQRLNWAASPAEAAGDDSVPPSKHPA